MAFSYSLFIVLLLLFPGFCFWAGIRSGERSDLLTPAPDRPNSTATLFLILVGAILGHLLGTTWFVVQRIGCEWTRRCIEVSYDPNVYRALLRGTKSTTAVSDVAFEVWLLAMLLVGVVTGALGYVLIQRETVRKWIDPLTFGWLNPAVQAVKAGDAFVVAYVLTKTSHEGAAVAYEGIVQQLGLDEDQSIKLVILSEVDRFVVSISPEGIERKDVEASSIQQLHITAAEIANIALEVVRVPKRDVEAVEAEAAQPGHRRDLGEGERSEGLSMNEGAPEIRSPNVDREMPNP